MKTPKKIVYLSGPISNIVGGNFREFALAQEKIEALGFTVLNPHDLCRNIDGNEYESEEAYWEACMRNCLCALPFANILVTLNNWEESRGAKIEVEIARATRFIEVEPITKFLLRYAS